MKKIALAVALAGLFALPACTTQHPGRRVMTDWNLAMLREGPNPCGSMQGSEHDVKNCGGNHEGTAQRAIDSIFVKPIAFAMLPISWATDTLILNPINGWKKAELQNYERRFCKAEENCCWSDAHAAHHAGGVVPTATPWILSEALYVPEFAARWVWNSTYPTDPVCQKAYNEYWQQHNEKSSQ